ncbi:DUF805 domain-containing protein [Prevotella sp.]|uniref:DUF805 domain-containing protein n=1 Tax=Prevotella sp. TaxID=59823 RepID=UPI0027E38BCF|nr:DUF805 domain-containing protein [Prevotella sp.]
MGLKEAVVSVFSKYATFSGRAIRSEYWFFYLFNIIMSFGLIAVCSIIGAIFKGLDGATGGYMVGAILYWIYAIAAFIPGLAVSVRRLHDTGRSGFNLFWMFLPIIGTILLIVYFATGSNPGDNAYGPEPEK